MTPGHGACRRIGWRLLGGAVCTALAACEPYRIEYRDRPAFYDSAGAEVPDRVTLPDGTIIVYRDRTPKQAPAGKTEVQDTPFLIREELENGDIELRGLTPEHVLTNTMTCLRNREYELMWNQLLAEQSKTTYVEEGHGPEQFAAYCQEHRHDLAATVNRMKHGLVRNEVVVDNIGQGAFRLRFHPYVGSQFKYQSVYMSSDHGWLKLAKIE